MLLVAVVLRRRCCRIVVVENKSGEVTHMVLLKTVYGWLEPQDEIQKPAMIHLISTNEI
jgi:hypothetical protein